MRALFALALAGCHGVYGLDLPAPAQTYVLVFTSDEEVREVHAYGAPPTLGARDGDTVYAVTFSCPPERLGLTPGVQQLLVRAPEAPLLPSGARVYETTLEGAPSWTQLDAAPEEVADALSRLPVPTDHTPCGALGARYVSTHLMMPDDPMTAAAFGVAVDGDTVLMGTALDALGHARVYEIDVTEGLVERREALEIADGLVASMSVAPDGKLWAISHDGELFSGDLEAGLRTVTSSLASPFSRRQWVLRTAASREGAFELYAAGAVGDRVTVGRFDGRAWAEHFERNEEFREFYRAPIAWMGRGSALAALPQGDILRVGTSSSVDPFERGNIVALLAHPTLGAVAGSEGGTVYVLKRAGEWDPIARTPLGYISALAVEGPGVLVAGSQRFLGQYYPEVDGCVVSSPVGGALVTELVRVGDDHLVAFTLRELTGSTGVAILTRTQEPSSCVD